MATLKYRDHEWQIIATFPTYEDAKAFQALAEEAFAPLEMIARPKGQYESAGNVANWRMTHALRLLLEGNSFDLERLQIAAQEARFSIKSATTWLTKATTHGVLRRLEKGVYEFLPPVAIAVASYTPTSQPFAPTIEEISPCED